jgi:hypothetical protein
MRQSLTIAVLAFAATGAQAEPKFSGLTGSKPAATPATAVVEIAQPKVVELAAPEIAIKTREVAGPDLDKRLAKRVDATRSVEPTAIRTPAKLNLPGQDEEAPATATAPSTAAASNR